MSMEVSRQKAAQAWGTSKTEKITMDTDVCEAFAEILDKETNIPRLGCATTRELLGELTARIKLDGKLDYRTIDIDSDDKKEEVIPK